jgi:hypothetical protein
MGVSGQRHAPATLYPPERTPGTHCTGGWVGPRAGLDTEVRGKLSRLCRGSNLDRPVVEPVARHYTDWATRLTSSICTSKNLSEEHTPIDHNNTKRQQYQNIVTRIRWRIGNKLFTCSTWNDRHNYVLQNCTSVLNHPVAILRLIYFYQW